MSAVYLIRHGQAGLRHNYDTLSDLGHTQARLLGEYLAAQKIKFAAIYSGALTRQQETAGEVRAALERAGLAAARHHQRFALERVRSGRSVRGHRAAVIGR